jgi:hypothetical protein
VSVATSQGDDLRGDRPHAATGFLLVGLLAVVLSVGGPRVLGSYHWETITYCAQHRGAQSVWQGSFGSGAVVLCRDSTVERYEGESRRVADLNQPAYVALVARWAMWGVVAGALLLVVGLIPWVRWYARV